MMGKEGAQALIQLSMAMWVRFPSDPLVVEVRNPAPPLPPSLEEANQCILRCHPHA